MLSKFILIIILQAKYPFFNLYAQNVISNLIDLDPSLQIMNNNAYPNKKKLYNY